MLIPINDIIHVLNQYNIQIHGVLHIGAHECEEMGFYQQLHILPNQILWIDGNREKVHQAITRRIPNVYHALITDTDDKEIDFHITNNGQSSSILELGTHRIHHPHIHFIETRKEKGITLDRFFERYELNGAQYDFWNLDIQGAELLALKGATQHLPFVKALYLEVNTEEVYKGCALIQDIDAFLKPFGFQRVLTYLTDYHWGDALYLKIESTIS
jgi:hypothetical protein